MRSGRACGLLACLAATVPALACGNGTGRTPPEEADPTRAKGAPHKRDEGHQEHDRSGSRPNSDTKTLREPITLTGLMYGECKCDGPILNCDTKLSEFWRSNEYPRWVRVRGRKRLSEVASGSVCDGRLMIENHSRLRMGGRTTMCGVLERTTDRRDPWRVFVCSVRDTE